MLWENKGPDHGLGNPGSMIHEVGTTRMGSNSNALARAWRVSAEQAIHHSMIVVRGSWLMAHGSGIMTRGSRLMARGPWP